MSNLVKIIIVIVGLVIVAALGYLFLSKNNTVIEEMMDFKKEQEEELKLVDFSEVNEEFKLSGQIPMGFEVEYLPQVRAINIYNSTLLGTNNLEKSQIYITYFRASRFLTLNTVDITKADKTTTLGKEAILYEITKKMDVPTFVGQPNWRNFTHRALDIRESGDSPTVFYSFAYNPKLKEDEFYEFIETLVFK